MLESWQREGREELVERLAHHAIQAEAWEKAVDYARRAGFQAMARSAHRDAVAWFDQAVAALGHLPDRRELVEQAIDLQFDLRNALWPLAEFRRVFDCLTRAEQLATTLGDQRRLAMAFALLTPMFSKREDRAQGIEYGRRALDIAAGIGDSTVQVVASLYLAMAYLTLGNYQRATKFARKNVSLLQGDVRLERFSPHGFHAEPAILPRALLLWSLAELGEFAQAQPVLEEGLRIVETINHPYSQTFLLLGQGILHVRQGDLPRAARTLERSLALCRHWKLAALFGVIAGHLGAAYTLGGPQRRGDSAPGGGARARVPALARAGPLTGTGRGVSAGGPHQGREPAGGPRPRGLRDSGVSAGTRRGSGGSSARSPPRTTPAIRTSSKATTGRRSSWRASSACAP